MTLRIGSHVSISGGFQNAVLEEEEIGGNCGQIFTHSPRAFQFPKADPKDENVIKFRKISEEKDIRPWFSHVSYLVNMATTKPDYWKLCVKMMEAELNAAVALGLEGIVVHPGANPDREKGITLINKALRALEKIQPDVWVLLENSEGKKLGGTVEELAKMIIGVKRSKLGICIDTCHAYVSGYDVSKKEGLNALLKKLDDLIGIEKLKAVHLNDSKAKLGDQIDRHDNTGMGHIGPDGMKTILNNRSIRKIPMIIEYEDNRKSFKDNIAAARTYAEK